MCLVLNSLRIQNVSVCSLYLPRHLTMCLKGVYKPPIQWLNMDWGLIISEKCFLPHTSPSSLFLKRRGMVLSLSFCWWRQTVHSGIITEKSVAIVQAFASYCIFEISQLISLLTQGLLSLFTSWRQYPHHFHPLNLGLLEPQSLFFTNLLGPYNTIKPNYPKNPFPLSSPFSNALDMCTSKDSANVTCHLPVTSTLPFWGRGNHFTSGG